MAWIKFRPIAYVTSLPATPVDGTEVYYQSTTAGTGGWTAATPSMADLGIVWHLRYRSASAGPKWEYVGGGSLYNEVNSEASTASTTYVSLGGPDITLPAPGDYQITLFMESFFNPAVTQSTLMTYQVGTSAADDLNRIMGYNNSAQAQRTTTMGVRYHTSLPAVRIASRYRVGSSATGFFTNRRLALVPIRVNAS